MLEAAKQFPGISRLLKKIASIEAQKLKKQAEIEARRKKPLTAKAAQKQQQKALEYLGEAAFAVDSSSGIVWSVKYLVKYCVKNKQKLVIFSERIGTMDMIEYLLATVSVPQTACSKLAIKGLHDKNYCSMRMSPHVQTFSSS